jgi:TetR/AcrR family transcriptional regulator, regulator of biofilm formation and stress response
MAQAATQPAGAGREAPRRRAIIDATIRILRTEGPGGVTHRAVAQEAGVPLAATTYYFSSKDELLEESLQLLAGEEAERLEALSAAILAQEVRPEELPAIAAAGLAALLQSEYELTLPKFEIYLEAARRPGLRPCSERWIEAFHGVAEAALRSAGAPDPSRGARLLVGAVDGMLLQRIAVSDDPPDEAELAATLERLLAALVAD